MQQIVLPSCPPAASDTCCVCFHSGIPGKKCGTIILSAEELGNCRVSHFKLSSFASVINVFVKCSFDKNYFAVLTEPIYSNCLLFFSLFLNGAVGNGACFVSDFQQWLSPAGLLGCI